MSVYILSLASKGVGELEPASICLEALPFDAGGLEFRIAQSLCDHTGDGCLMSEIVLGAFQTLFYLTLTKIFFFWTGGMSQRV